MTTNLGIKLSFETELDQAYTSDKEGVGCIRHEGDAEFVWLKGLATIIKGFVVVFSTADYAATLFTNAITRERRLAVAASEATGSKWGWFQIRGKARHGVYAAHDCAADAQLFSTATAGMVDDAPDGTAGGIFINGMVLNAACGTSPGATCGADLNYPNAASDITAA